MALYYAEVQRVVGGALALHNPSGEARTLVNPVTGQLVTMAGGQIHSVEPLAAGNRITVVTNLPCPWELVECAAAPAPQG
jgi:predicted 2-oxoglutarate/Fe(II)-dependent dioxygenase YbiX